MPSMNNVFLMGNLTRDVELRTLPSGTPVATLRLAISDEYTNKQGERVDKTVFVDVEAWDKLAENCRRYLAKGSPALVEGQLKMDEWKTPEGETRSKIKVTARRVQFLGNRGDNSPVAPENGTGASTTSDDADAMPWDPADPATRTARGPF